MHFDFDDVKLQIYFEIQKRFRRKIDDLTKFN